MTTKEGDQIQTCNAGCSTTTESKWPSVATYLSWMIKDKLALSDDMTMTTKEGDQIQTCNARCSTTTESKWPSVPTYLLWMIKDKLALSDDMRLSAVCRDWWIASNSSYPRNQSRGNGSPCLMHIRNKSSCNIHRRRHFEQSGQKLIINSNIAVDFVCATTKRSYTLDLRQFYSRSVLYSKQGWFLTMKRSTISEPSVLLMNPIRKETIQLPFVGQEIFSVIHGSFSIREGYPHRVVLLFMYYKLNPITSTTITIRTASPGDKMWTEHTYTGYDFYRDCGGPSSIRAFITIEQHVYCIYRSGTMLVFNMNTNICRKVLQSHDDKDLKGYYSIFYVAEFEGHLVEVCRRSWGAFRFFRYNDATTSWESLTGVDLKDTSWYISDCPSHSVKVNFVTKEKGLKVYLFRDPFNYESQVVFSRKRVPNSHSTHFHVVRYDLMDGSREFINLPYCIPYGSVWVEI